MLSGFVSFRVWETEKAPQQWLQNGLRRQQGTLTATWEPGRNQDHTGHSRRTGDSCRVNLPAPATSRGPGKLSGPVGSSSWICFSSTLVPMPSSQFYLLIRLFGKGTAERTHCPLPPVTLLTLMFTAPRLSTAPGPSSPADGELTVFIGLGTLRGWRLHTGVPSQPRLFSFLHLLTALEPPGWLRLGFQNRKSHHTLAEASCEGGMLEI